MRYARSAARGRRDAAGLRALRRLVRAGCEGLAKPGGNRRRRAGRAAAIDGATGAQKFFRITIPLLRRSIGTTYILALSGTINLSFTLSNVMTGGGPNGASSVLLQYMYTQGMRNANFGYAMAIAMFTLLLAIVLAKTVS